MTWVQDIITSANFHVMTQKKPIGVKCKRKNSRQTVHMKNDFF